MLIGHNRGTSAIGSVLAETMKGLMLQMA